MLLIHGRIGGVAAFMGGLLAALACAGDARSRPLDGTRKACVDTHVAAQERRQRDDLLGARDLLRTCASVSCPGMVRADCTKWLDEVVEAIPSIVLGAKRDEESILDVRVTMDGRPFVGHLDGTPIEVNPGLHTFVFERAGSRPLEKQVIIAAHVKSQMVGVSWKTAQDSARAGVAEGSGAPAPGRPVPVGVYALGAAAFVGFGVFAVLGLTGRDQQQHLEATCSPTCKPGDVDDLRARYLAADVAAGLGALSAAGALILYVARPDREAPPQTRRAIDFVSVDHGAAIRWRGSF